jgi:hypothetical protein
MVARATAPLPALGPNRPGSLLPQSAMTASSASVNSKYGVLPRKLLQRDSQVNMLAQISAHRFGPAKR